MTEETRYAIALSYLSGVGPIRARRLLARAGGFAAAFMLPPDVYDELKIGSVAREQIASGRALELADKELSYVTRHNICVLDCLHEDYPKRLASLPDSPVVLYHRGEQSPDVPRTLAIVGTRKPTSYGRAFCDEFIAQLVDYNVTVVSGLAYGIDVAAHEACLRHGVDTVGVLAHGLAELYPAAHRQVAQQMLKGTGLLTEYPSGLRSRREYFPQRNRIIAAMSDAVVVVESAERGGSMITANLALGYDKPIFALPGRVRDKMSAGPNMLIKSNRASLLQSAADLGYLLGWEANDSGEPTRQARLLFENFEPKERRVIDALQDHDDLDIDSLLSQLDLSHGELANLILELEFKGAVKSLPGKRYTLH